MILFVYMNWINKYASTFAREMQQIREFDASPVLSVLQTSGII